MENVDIGLQKASFVKEGQDVIINLNIGLIIKVVSYVGFL